MVKSVAAGKPSEVANDKNSITGMYLSGRKKIDIPKKRRPLAECKYMSLRGVTTNNLKNIDVDFPIGRFTAVTGVSGCGKSSLVLQTLCSALNRILNKARSKYKGVYKGISGTEYLDKMIEIDQSPIGRTPLSNAATYTGAFTNIREWFVRLPESRARGYKIGRFSFNAKGGRCEACTGDGFMKIEMYFLPDVYVECEHCRGKRYNRETLEVRYKGKSIADVLAMTVEEAYDFFREIPNISEILGYMKRVGLGYLPIGLPATMLSGGEAQRVKLAKELSKKSTGSTVYVLDEPTTGLHTDDIKNLLQVLNMLVDSGNTVIVIEHNLHVIKTADYIIDVGPEGGDAGGEIIGCGSPEDVAYNENSITGKYLRDYIKDVVFVEE